MGKYMQLFETDGLALFAVGGLAATVLVTVVLFLFVLTRRNPQTKA